MRHEIMSRFLHDAYSENDVVMNTERISQDSKTTVPERKRYTKRVNESKIKQIRPTRDQGTTRERGRGEGKRSEGNQGRRERAERKTPRFHTTNSPDFQSTVVVPTTKSP